MKFNYDKDLDKNIQKVLDQIIKESEPWDTDSEFFVTSNSRLTLDYLKEIGIFRYVDNIEDAYFVALSIEGVKLLAKYNTWSNYKKKVINKEKRKANSNYNKLRFWWLPIAISIIALAVSILGIIFKDL